MPNTTDGFLALYEARRPEIDAILKPVPADERERFLVLTVRAIREHKHRDGGQCRCTHQSMVQCVIDCAAMALEPGTGDDLIYLIPYGNELTARPSWKGLVKNAVRTRIVDHIVADLVREGDKFKAGLINMRRTVQHEYGKKRGETQRVYALAFLSNGVPDFEVLEQTDVQAVMDAAKRTGQGKLSPAWREFPGEMAKKSAIRRLLKRLTGTRRIEGPDAAHLAAIMEATLKADNQEFDLEGHQSRVTAGETTLDEIADTIAANEPPPPAPEPEKLKVVPPKPKADPVLTVDEQNELLKMMVKLGFEVLDLQRLVKELSGHDTLASMKQSELSGFIQKMQQKAAEVGTQA